MRERFVVDSSVALAWLFDEAGAAVRIERAITGVDLIAPGIWRLEIVNAILVKERGKLFTLARGAQLLELMEDWQVQLSGEPQSRNLIELAALARPHQLGAYDATYLALAVSLGLPLYTYDNNLCDAAMRMGVPLVEESSRK